MTNIELLLSTLAVKGEVKCIQIHINEFVDILKQQAIFNPITDRNILQTGWYGTIPTKRGAVKICVGYITGPGNFRTSLADSPHRNAQSDWSEEQSIDQWIKDNQYIIILV